MINIIKRALLLFCAIIFCAYTAVSEDYMTSPRAWIAPGNSQPITVNLVSENIYRGFECKVTSLESDVIEEISLDNGLNDKFTIITNKVDDKNWRLAVYSVSDAIIPAGDTPVLNIIVRKPQLPIDETLLQITDVTMATAENQEVKIQGCLISVNPFMETMSISPATIDLQRGDEYIFNVVTTPSWPVLPTMSWTSSDPEKASVDMIGRVTAIASKGEVTITAQYNELVATSKVILHGKKPQTFTFDKPLYSLDIGKTCQANLIIEPIDADVTVTNLTVDKSWIATVSPDGLITAISEGTAHLKATLEYEQQIFEAEAEIAVGIPLASSVTLDCNNKTLKQGESFSLIASIEPSEAVQIYSWSVDDEQIVSIRANNNECVVTPINLGKTLIRVKTTDGSDLTATCSIEVIPADVYSVKILQRYPTIAVNATYQLIAEVLPENALDKTVIWSVSDPSIATIDNNGIIHPITVGKTTVTARCGDVSDEITLTITERYPDYLDIVFSDSQFIPGYEYSATYTYAPDNITVDLIWEITQDGDIIEYSIDDKTLKFKCLNEGDVTITVKAGERTYSRDITVQEADLNLYSLVLKQENETWNNASKISWTPLPENTKIEDYKVFVECKPKELENEIVYDCSEIPANWSKNLIDFYTSSSLSHDGKSFKFANTASKIESNIYPKYLSAISFWHKGASVQAGNQLIVEGHTEAGWENIETIALDNTEHVYVKQFTERTYNALRLSYNKVAGGNLAVDDIKLNFYDYENQLDNGNIQHPRYWGYSVGMADYFYFAGKIEEAENYYFKVRAYRGDNYLESNTITPAFFTNYYKSFVPLQEIVLDSESYEVAIDRTITVIPTLVPSNCTISDLIWTIDDESIATIDEGGVITGASLGKTKVTISPQDNSFMKPVTFNLVVSETGGIGPNVIKESGELEIYNLQGVYVGNNLDQLSKGFYIVRQGSRTEKIAVK